jgi:5-methyltetrahydropteroyltriglutamate--homocysteine methyltransferase
MKAVDRILTTHVGSLIRPEDLIPYFRKIEANEPYDEGTFERRLSEAVEEVVKRQVETGIDVVSDGEYGKSGSWSRYILGRISGFERSNETSVPPMAGKDHRDFKEFYEEYENQYGYGGIGKGIQAGTWIVKAPIRYTGKAKIERDIENFKKALATTKAVDGFLPVVTPSAAVIAARDEHYKNEGERLQAFAQVMREEYHAIHQAGLLVQVDDAYIPGKYDVMCPPAPLEDYQNWVEGRVEAINVALSGIPEDRVRFHVCWGSWNGPHTNDVSLKNIVDLIFKVRAKYYSIEMANPRHEHEWRVFEEVKLPEGKVLMPGVISHCTNVVEHPELVAERLLRLANLVGRERVMGSSDCGFAQSPFARRVHPTIMWAKLATLVRGAELATSTLWGKRQTASAA